MAQAPNIVNLHQLGWTEHSHGTRFAMRRKALGAAAAGKQLGCSYYELPPGKTAFPYHFHTANEEAFYVLEGEAALRTPASESDLSAGDYVTFCAGPGGAHQIRNRGETPLRYLCVSTMVAPEVLYYPDSNKIGVMAGSAPGGPKAVRTITAFVPADAAVDYWQGED